MMKPTTLLLPALLAIASVPGLAAKDAAKATAKDARPQIPLFKSGQITPRCDAGLADLASRAAALEKMPLSDAKNAKSVLAKWDDLAVATEDLQGPFDFLSNVDPDPQVRSEMEACLVRINAFTTQLFQNEKLFQLIKATAVSDIIDAKLRQDALDGFEDTGVTLPKAKQQRMLELAKKLDELAQEYARNVRDNTEKLAFSADEVKGLPESYLAKAKRDDKGNYLLGYDKPDYFPFMESSENSAARKRFEIGYENRGGAKNLAVLAEATQLRREMAGLFGFDNYADYVQRRRMAERAKGVLAFLDAVQQAIVDVEKKEIEQLRVFKAERLKTALLDTTMPRWDQLYWQEQLKKARFNVDQEALRKYFPTEAAIPWILDVSAKLYGVKFAKAEVPTWHKDVRYYDVQDGKTGKRIGGIYLDLFPRDGKYGHAAAWGVRGVSTRIGRTPISGLVTNFNREGFNSDELETLVHEFGHVLHGVLSHTRYVRHAGTNVELDFVEAPSQMYEEWARSKQSLSLLAEFCKPACPKLDDALLGRLTAAHNYGRGMRYGRQLLLASFDMAIHGPQQVDPLVAWQKLQGATPLGYIEGTQFPGQFGHLMNGYGAGYYGYMWSEVLALDMLSAYGDKLMNPEVGARYRKEILSKGGEMRGGALVHNFLQREPNPKAFFDEITGQRLK
jgi:thimet oligopeptidase